MTFEYDESMDRARTACQQRAASSSAFEDKLYSGMYQGEGGGGHIVLKRSAPAAMVEKLPSFPHSQIELQRLAGVSGSETAVCVVRGRSRLGGA
jgi:hypothetical protein